MLYESKATPKTPLGIVSVRRTLAEVPPAQHAAVVEELRKALCDDTWSAGQKALGDKLEALAVNLASNAGDLSKVPPALAAEINDLASQRPWMFESRDTFFEIRAKLSEVLIAAKP